MVCQHLIWQASRQMRLHFSENLNPMIPPPFGSAVSIPIRNTQPSLTTSSLLALRKQMEESNHEMLNLLTQHISTMFNPLIEDTNNSYQALSTQMKRIANFFGAPPV